MNKKNDHPIQYIERSSGMIITESVMGSKALDFAYNTLLGRSLWGLLFNTGFLSRLLGAFYDSKLSRKSIESLIKIPGLKADEAEKDYRQYESFNDFFTRRLKPGARPLGPGDDVLPSPADGRLLVYPSISPSALMPVKGAMRSLNTLCGQELPADFYSVAVIRLAPVDYHRYHYPCDCCKTDKEVYISGKYHSVNPVAFAKAPDLFTENTRCITKLKSDVFGEFLFLEVGAFGVGSIVNLHAATTDFQKGDEKGFFKFGGSTVILIMESDKVQFDSDLIKNSSGSMETLIRYGERIGVATV